MQKVGFQFRLGHRADVLSLSEGRLVVTVRPNDRCLIVVYAAVWEVVEQKLIALPSLNPQTRKLKHMLIGHADDCDMDGQEEF